MKRGPCWYFKEKNKVGPTVEGTVLEDAAWGTTGVRVKWDNGEYYEALRWGTKQHGVENCDIWDSTSGKIVKTLEGHEGSVNCVTFSPDGSLLASCSNDTTTKVR